MSLTFNDYQRQAQLTAIYPEAGTKSIFALMYTALGLSEAGEVQGKIKKLIRDKNAVITPADAKEIAKEIGDILWYCAMLSRELGVPFEEIAEENLQKLSSRKARGAIKGDGDNR